MTPQELARLGSIKKKKKRRSFFFFSYDTMVAVCLLFLFYKRAGCGHFLSNATEYTQHNRTLSHISSTTEKNDGEASRRAMVFTKEKGGGKR